jgi:hypothetical protein
MLLKKTVTFALLLCNCAFSFCQAQNLDLLIKERSGTITSFKLNNVRCLTFKDHTITVRRSDTNESNYALSDIQFLSFGTSTGIAPIEGGEYDKIKLFPNPVSELLTCEFTINKLDEVVLHIFGLDGKILFQRKYLIVSGLNRITMPVSFLQNGIYFIRIQNSEMDKTFKFIKCN